MSNGEVKRWKKKTWLNIDVLFEDEFYARTPDLIKTFPPTVKGKYTVIGQNETRSTLEELPLDPPKEKEEKKQVLGVEITTIKEEKTDEKIIKEDIGVGEEKPTEV